MTKLLENAFARASQLSEEEQEALARFIIQESESYSKWDTQLASSEDVLESLASTALDEFNKGSAPKLDLDRDFPKD